MIEDLSAFIATVLAVSLTTERLVAVVKTSFPVWMAAEKKTDSAEIDLVGDRWRRLRVQLVAFLVAWVASASLADFKFISGSVQLGTSAVAIPVVVLAILSMGGSAFWSSVVAYASAAKDIQVQAKASGSLAFQAQARSQGRVPMDSGIVAVERGSGRAAPNLATALGNITTLAQPAFEAAPSRVVSHG
jgi:hypothetical protein